MDCLPGSVPRPSALDFAETFPKTLSLVAHPVRCGKPACRCARGDLHGSWRLVWREHGRQRHRYVRAADLAAVRAAIERRRAAERAERIDRALALATLRGWKQWLREIEQGMAS